MNITTDRWDYLNAYSREVFGGADEHLEHLMEEAVVAGLPDIAVSADVGRLLMILTSLTGAKLAIEVGTLAGYSGIWIARGLAEGGKLITIEKEPKHAAFAREQFARAGVSDQVELRCADAMTELDALASELAPGSVDVAFLDAEKVEYADYWRRLRPLIAVGGLAMADNAYATGSWFIDDEGDAERDATDGFNRLVAGDADFEAVAVPIRQGVLIARRTR